MMLKKKILFILFGTLLFAYTAVAQAGENRLTVQHRLVNTEQVEMGTEATIELTVTNSGTSALSNINLVQLNPLKLHDPYSQSLSLGDLAVDGTTTRTWVISTLDPADHFRMAEILRDNLILDVEAANEASVTVHFMAISQRELP